MTSVATNPRRRSSIMLRKARYRATEIPRRLGMTIPADVKSIGVIGTQEPARLAEARTRLAWAAPPGLPIIMPAPGDTQTPKWAGVDIPDVLPRIEISDPRQADLQVLSAAEGSRWVRRVVDRRVMIGDPYWYSAIEVENHITISSVGTTGREWDAIRKRSADLLGGLVAKYEGDTQVAVFGTGPSMTTVDPASLDADVTIACNSVVSNREWLASAKPAVVAFGDPVFHFGPSRYAAQFRTDLRRTADETDAMFAVPERFVPLLERYLPEVASRTIAVAHSSQADLRLLAAGELTVPKTANVLTLLMLPFALALGSDVAIAGCDGRRPSERYFWTHNPELQYEDDLMNSAFDAHPSFFRDRDYSDYYETHCSQLEAMLSEAEDDGVRFRSITHSEIPALERRSA